MGMPITSYNIMNVLDKGGEHYEVAAVEGALEPFNLFAFILHNPEDHPDFDKAISWDFDYLDYLTGDELLFFALVDPPKEWLEHGANRPYYQKLSQQSQQLLSSRNATISTNKDITAFSLAHILGIPYEKLPCLVISPDFRSNSFVWLRTCKKHIEEQLKRLGYIATGRTGNISTATFRNVINSQGVDLCDGIGSESLERSLAKDLAEIMSFMVANDNSKVQQQVINVINELRNILRNLKEDIQETISVNELDRLEYLDSQLDEYSLRIVYSLAHLNTKKDLDFNNFIDVQNGVLENDSYLMLKTVYTMLNLFNNKSYGEPLAIEGMFNSDQQTFDYAPAVMCLAKVFEKEINLSVVHWIRENLGVRLPQYFNKYQPRNIPTFDNVNFNKRDDNDTWSPPTLGTSLEACKKVSKTNEQLGVPPPRLYNNWDVFLQKWDAIKDERNTAAHTMVVVDENSVYKVRDALNWLSRRDIFKALCEMKNEYRGQEEVRKTRLQCWRAG